MGDVKSRKGYRVVGRTAINGELKSWEFDTLEVANEYAKFLCVSSQREVDVMKYIGSWKATSTPTEYIAATDVNVI